MKSVTIFAFFLLAVNGLTAEQPAEVALAEFVLDGLQHSREKLQSGIFHAVEEVSYVNGASWFHC